MKKLKDPGSNPSVFYDNVSKGPASRPNFEKEEDVENALIQSINLFYEQKAFESKNHYSTQANYNSQ